MKSTRLTTRLTSQVLSTKFCQGHTLNGYCAKRASNLDAKVGLLTFSDPRQHKRFFFQLS